MSEHAEVPIRFTVFTDRPDCLLLYVSGEREVRLPPSLTAPFTRETLTPTLSQMGIPVRIIESRAGRWTTAAMQAKMAAKAESGQRHRLELTQAAARAVSKGQETYAEALARKARVDMELRDLKQRRSMLNSDAKKVHGRYVASKEFVELSRRIDTLQCESQALQTQLGQLRRAHAESSRSTSLQRFVNVARDYLDPEEFQEIWDIAHESGDSP